MKIAICDDELYFGQELKKMIENYYNSMDLLISVYQNPTELLRAIKKDKSIYQAVFLDIEMPDMDGMTLAKLLREEGVEIPIIFLTSHEEQMEEGYEVRAFRFLVKPVNKEKLEKALSSLFLNTFSKRQLSIIHNGRNHILYEKDILCIKSENVYLKIFTKEGTYLIREKLNNMEAQLDRNYFIRVHRSYLINFSSILSYDKKKIDLQGHIEVPISRSSYENFQKAFMNYLKTSKR